MQIFIGRNGIQLGSWSEEEVRSYFQTGNLIATDHYWHEGMTQWDTLDNFNPPLTPAVSPTAPLPPAAAPAPGVRSRPSTSASTKHKPSPSPVAWIFPLVLACLLALLAGPAHPDSNAAEKAGGIVGSALFFCIVAFPLSLVFPRGWRLAVRCVIMLGLAGLMFIGKQAQASDKWMAEIKSFGSRESQDERRQIARDGYVKNTNDQKVNAELQKLHDMAQGESDANRKLSDVTLDVLKDIKSHQEACRVAEQPMLDLGLAPSKITSLDDLDKRRAAIRNAQQAVDDFIAYLQGLDTTIRQELLAKGASPAATDGFMKGLHQSGKLQSLLTYWQQEGAISSDLLANLDLLKTNWGHWHVENGTVIFDSDGAVTDYQANITRLNADVAAQKSVQAQLLTLPQ